MLKKDTIEKVAVLGAGVMGSQIAALVANAGCVVELYDLPENDNPTGLAEKGVQQALKSRPSAFFSRNIAESVRCRSIHDLGNLNSADWIIEAVVEDLESKRQLFSRVEAAISSIETVQCISTNTSGLSVNGMVASCSPGFRSRFMGVHFFNPPRHMKLVELIPTKYTDSNVVQSMAQYLEAELGKGVVQCRDTPNFIGNRVGVFALMDVIHRMQAFDLRVEEVDAITGVLIGRPRSATLRLCDIIGIDVLVKVAATAQQNLVEDKLRDCFSPPAFLQEMYEKNLLGDKTDGGFYRKNDDGEIEVLDFSIMDYRPREEVNYGELTTIMDIRSLPERLQALSSCPGKLAHFARDHVDAVIWYAIENATEMASDILHIDQAMKWGFNWEAGPLEIADMLGLESLRQRFEVSSGKCVPELMRYVVEQGNGVFYSGERDSKQSFSISEKRYCHPQHTQPDDTELIASSTVVDSSEHARLLEVNGGEILVFSGKLNIIGSSTLAFVQRVLAERNPTCLVLYGDGGNFSAGADLGHMMGLIESDKWGKLEEYVANFQDACMSVRFAPFPVVAAARGLVLGGGCEFCLSSTARVVGAETRIGLVETSVGLIPGASGCKEMARRHSGNVPDAFRTIFHGRFSDNAREGQEWGLLQHDDEIYINDQHIVSKALRIGCDLASNGYQAPTDKTIDLVSLTAADIIHQRLNLDFKNGRLSAHDVVVGERLARVLCGSSFGSRQVAEQEFLDLEREVFLGLCGMKKTQERITHMLKTGKPLRN